MGGFQDTASMYFQCVIVTRIYAPFRKLCRPRKYAYAPLLAPFAPEAVRPATALLGQTPGGLSARLH